MPYRWRWLPTPLVGHANTIGTLVNAIDADNAYQRSLSGWGNNTIQVHSG